MSGWHSLSFSCASALSATSITTGLGAGVSREVGSYYRGRITERPPKCVREVTVAAEAQILRHSGEVSAIGDRFERM
jgi:hypothetical protein